MTIWVAVPMFTVHGIWIILPMISGMVEMLHIKEHSE